MKLALGQKVTLFKYKAPGFSTSLKYSKSLTYPTPVPGVSVKGTAGLSLSFSVGATFGLDTTGFKTGNLLDGFFVEDAKATVKVTLFGSASVTVGVSFIKFAEAGVYGQGGATLTLSLKDPNHDGRTYGSEISSFAGAIVASGKLKYEFGVYVSYKKIHTLIPLKYKSYTDKKTLTSGTLDLS
jgi:hypothetical protein